MDNEETMKHQQEMAQIEADKENFNKAPFCYTVLGAVKLISNLVFWITFWSVVAQCSCDGCIWK